MAETYLAKVAECEVINTKYRYFHLELIKPYRLEFKAGQYISINIGGGERRSYSIASSPVSDYKVELCVDVTPSGKGTEYIKALKPGSEVEFLAPLGLFTIEATMTDLEKNLLFIATGSGITPFRSMLLDLLDEKKSTQPMKLFWGMRHQADLFWAEDFRRLHKVYENFEFHLTLSQPPEIWPLCSGHITECINNELTLDASWGAYVCGNRKMIEEMKLLLAKKGIPEKQIHFEKFY